MPYSGLQADPSFRYSVKRWLGDGEQTNWEIGFAGGYLRKEHVKAKVTDLAGNTTEQAFEWVGDFTIRINPPVPEDYLLTVFRDTPKTLPLADFEDGAVINEKNLNDNAKQAIFVAAEALDRGEGTLSEIADRALIVPAGELAPSIPARNQLKGKLLAVSADGKKIEGVGITGSGDFIPTSGMILHEGEVLASVIELQADALVQEAQERVAGIAAEASRLDDRIDATGAAIVAEQTARQDADGAFAETLDAVVARTDAAEAAIIAEQTARSDADGALASDIQAVIARVDTAEANIVSEQTARADADEAAATAIEGLLTRMGDAEAAAITETSARVTEDEALAESIDQLTTRVGDAEAAAINEATTRANADGALAESVSLVTSQIEAAKSLIYSSTTASSNREAALAHSLMGLVVKLGQAQASIVSDKTAQVTSEGVFTRSLDSLTARVAGAEASVTTEQSARIAGDAANASAITALTSTVNGNTATLTAQAGTIATLNGKTAAYWQVDAVAGGRAQLRIYADANGGGGVDITGDVKINGNLLVSGSVTATHLASNSVGTTQIQNGSVIPSKISVTSLDALSATIGVLRTATSGARVEIRDNLIQVFDASNVLRVRIGVW